MIDLGIEEGMILKSGAWYTLLNDDGTPMLAADGKTPLKWQGVANMRDFFDMYPFFKDEMSKKLQNKMMSRLLANAIPINLGNNQPNSEFINSPVVVDYIPENAIDVTYVDVPVN